MCGQEQKFDRFRSVAGKEFPEGQFILTDIFETLLRDVLPANGGQATDKASE